MQLHYVPLAGSLPLILLALLCDAAHEVGPWSVFAADSLVVQDGLYAADCSVRTLPGVAARCVRIERSDFQQQLLHSLPRRDSRTSPCPSPRKDVVRAAECVP